MQAAQPQQISDSTSPIPGVTVPSRQLLPVRFHFGVWHWAKLSYFASPSIITRASWFLRWPDWDFEKETYFGFSLCPIGPLCL